MKTCYLILIAIIFLAPINLEAQRSHHKKVYGTFSQQYFYRFIIIEFKKDMTFNFHIMSKRAHKNTIGSFKLNGDTIILNSTTDKTEFDFKKTKWLILSPKKILMSNNKSVSKESWSVLEKDKSYEFVPDDISDLKIKVDSIKKNSLGWKEDTTNYDSELKVIIHEPLPPKEPVVIMDGLPVKYEFLLNYHTLADIHSITYTTADNLINNGIHGGQAEYGVIILTTNKNKPKR